MSDNKLNFEPVPMPDPGAPKRSEFSKRVLAEFTFERDGYGNWWARDAAGKLLRVTFEYPEAP